jgi:hypothetical protein
VGEDHPELLFTAGGPHALAEALRHFVVCPERLEPLRQAARRRFEARFIEAKNYERLMEINGEVSASAVSIAS